MSNEKRSDSWLDKLDGLEGLPGEAPFDKMAAWERLHHRLNEKKGKKRAVWYWAAACLFIASMVLVLPKQGRKDNFSPPAVSRVDIRDSNVQKEQVIVKEPILVIADTPVERKVIPSKEKRNAITADIAAIIPPVISPAPHLDTIQEETATVAAAPHKMRVVHINEVGGDVIGNAYVYPEHKQFKIAISGPAGFASQVVADKTSKTLSPKN
ncbi:hypothetical protein [Chitinophaga sp. S165]|uniref:hypothetical protein n=1 Tax=Chitinophaga sp. S165 TaxID=2135462 RepID=UPI000D718265|nr:hypothetical protein [Chitinophaga sp. S165]PWV49613.1 hypothetical protein C7475_105121 [Chitinophaga sp. S165]